MKSIQAEVIIEKPTKVVWENLLHFDSFSEWNPYIISITGKPVMDSRLSVKVHLPGYKTLGFKPRIIKLNPEKELRWLGKILFSGLFDGEHYFQLFEMENGNTLFVQGEHFTGFFTRFFKDLLNKTEEGFELMNNALKDRCEKL